MIVVTAPRRAIRSQHRYGGVRDDRSVPNNDWTRRRRPHPHRRRVDRDRGQPGPGGTGKDFTYTLTAPMGTQPRRADTVVDVLPAGVEYQGSRGGWACGEDSGIVACAVGPARGATRVLSLIVRAPGEAGVDRHGLHRHGHGRSVPAITPRPSRRASFLPARERTSAFRSGRSRPGGRRRCVQLHARRVNAGTRRILSVANTLPSVRTLSRCRGRMDLQPRRGVVTCARDTLGVGSRPASDPTHRTRRRRSWTRRPSLRPRPILWQAATRTPKPQRQRRSPGGRTCRSRNPDSPDPVSAGALCALTVINAGPRPASDVRVTDTLPRTWFS